MAVADVYPFTFVDNINLPVCRLEDPLGGITTFDSRSLMVWWSAEEQLCCFFLFAWRKRGKNNEQ